MKTSYSLFTLYKPYLTIMYLVRQCDQLARQCDDQVLERDVKNYMKRNPEASEEDAIRSAIKHVAPKTMPGTPRYFWEKLQNLLSIVEHHSNEQLLTKRRKEIESRMEEDDKSQSSCREDGASDLPRRQKLEELEKELKSIRDGEATTRGFSATESGLPFLFLTLTADEVSEYKWQCIRDLEKDLKKINQNLDFRDAPVECARIFHKRCERFMSEWIYVDGGRKKGVFGRVLDYVIRYEIQDRG